MVRKSGFLSLVVILLLATAPSQPAWGQTKARPESPAQKPIYGGVYRRPLDNDPTTLDPSRIAEIYGRTVAQQIFDGLVQFDATLNLEPAIAQSWKATRDGLVWTFYLRKGVKFHHGREVTADDFIYSFTRILDPRVKSGGAAIFENVKGAQAYRDGKAGKVDGFQALDRYTLQITLLESFAPFVAALAVGYAKVVPREVVEKLGDEFGLRPVGTGPFKLERWTRGREIVLQANPDYFGGRPYLDRLEYRIFSGAQYDGMLVAFEAGALEDTFIPTKARERLVAERKYHYIRRPMYGVRYFGMNTQAPPLSDRRVRQALNYAIDQEALVTQVWQGRFPVANGIIPPGTIGFNPKLVGYPYNPAKARELLAQAGYPGGKGLPKLTLWSSVKFDDLVRENEAVRKYFADIGVQLEVAYNTDWPSFAQMLREGRAQLFGYAWYADVPDPDNFLYKLFHSTSSSNVSFFRNPHVDELLRRAREETEIVRRMALYQEAEQRVMDEAPIIPRNHHSYERVFQPYVRSVEVSGLGDPYIPMRKVWFDKGDSAAGGR